MRRPLILLTGLALLGCVLLGPGRVSRSYAAAPSMPLAFATAANHGTGRGAVSVAVGDLNGDGKPDIVTANSDDNTISVLLGNGDGTFRGHKDYATGSTPKSVAVADVNRDGKLDIVTANSDDNTVSVLLGNGDGTFQTHKDYAVGQGPQSVAVANLHWGGSEQDIITANSGGTVSVLLGNSDGTFAGNVDYVVGGQPSDVVAVDVNGDHFPDLIVANAGDAKTVIVLLGFGNGAFNVNHSTIADAFGSKSVAVADVNGDGKPDILATDVGVGVVLGKGDGWFQSHVDYGDGVHPNAVTVADLNGDGKPDLVLVAAIFHSIYVLPGNGDGSFQKWNQVGTVGGPVGVAVADLNGDGKLDVVTANPNDDNVTVLLNTSPFAAQLGVAGPAQPVAPGQLVTVTLTPQTSAGATASRYRGTVHFTSSDPQAALPDDYTFTAASAGTHTFHLALMNGGNQTVTATDTQFGTIAGTVTVGVQPAVSAISVTKGPQAGGTTVTVSGGGFAPGTSGTTISFGPNNPATNVNCSSTTSCTAKSPSGSGVVDVLVTVNGQTSATSNADQFIYLPVPAVSSISPASGPAAGGTLVTIRGSGFDPSAGGTTISFGGVQAAIAHRPEAGARPVGDGASTTVSCASASLCYAVSPPGSAGAVDLTVTTAGGTSATGSAVRFTYGVAAGLVLQAPAAATAGSPISVTVTAQDAGGATASGYAGTVHFTSTDAQAGLPADYSFTPADQGAHTFSNAVTLKTAGSQSVTVTDMATGALTASATTTVGLASPSRFAVSVPANVTDDAPFSVTVTAEDADGNPTPSYTGTVHLAGSDPAGSLPADYTFASADDGAHTFSGISLRTLGSQTVTASDTAPGGISGTSAGILVSVGAAPAVSGLSVTVGPLAGGTQLTLSGIELANATAVSFAGTPASFQVISDTQLTVTSPGVSAAGTVDVTVTADGQISSAGPADQFTYLAAPSVSSISPAVGPTGGGTLVQLDGSGFDTRTGGTTVLFGTTRAAIARKPAAGTQPTATGASTTVSCASDTVCYAVSPPGADGTVDVTVSTAGGSSATSSADQFHFGLTDHFALQAPATATAGTAVSLTVTAQDSAGNTTTAYTGRVHFTSSDARTALPADYTFTAADSGSHTFNGGSGGSGVTLNTAGDQTVTATDTTQTSIAGTTSPAVRVSAGPPAGFAVSAPATAGDDSPFSLTVTAQDAQGNTTAGYTGTIRFSSSDTAASLPADYPFIESDHGVHTFTGVILRSVGSQTISAADTTAAKLTGASGSIAVQTGAAPVVTGVSPAVGPPVGGTAATISGSGFGNATAVSFGNTAASSFHVDSDTQITATSPAGSLGSVDVVVTADTQRSAPNPPADQFSYVPVVVTGVSPARGTPFTTVTLSGYGLTARGSSTKISIAFPTAGGHAAGELASADTQADAGDADAAAMAAACPRRSCTVDATNVKCNSAGTSCTATVPAPPAKDPVSGKPYLSGTAVYVLVTAGKQSAANHPADQFTFEAPVLSDISPRTAPAGATLTLTGTWFGDKQNTAVGFVVTNGSRMQTLSATVLACQGGTTCTVAVPVPPKGFQPDAGVVVSVGGLTSGPGVFTYGAPAVTGVQRTTGSKGELLFVLTGTGFGQHTEVDLSPVAGSSKQARPQKLLNVACESGTQCTVKAQPEPAGTTVDVTVTLGGLTSAKSAADQVT